MTFRHSSSNILSTLLTTHIWIYDKCRSLCKTILLNISEHLQCEFKKWERRESYYLTWFSVLWIRIRFGSGFNGVPGSGSGLDLDSVGTLDPDPVWIWIQWGPWIRIRFGSGFNGVPGSGSAFPIRIRIQDSQINADRDGHRPIGKLF